MEHLDWSTVQVIACPRMRAVVCSPTSVCPQRAAHNVPPTTCSSTRLIIPTHSNRTCHTGLSILLNVAAGALVAFARWMPFISYKHINSFVFKVALPCHIARGIGIKTDLYRSSIWRFVSAFLLLRLIALVIVIAFHMLVWCASQQRTCNAGQ